MKGVFCMISNKTKGIAKEIRDRFKADGISNRNISVVCRESKYEGVKVETIYVIVVVPNSAIDAYVKPILKGYIEKYTTEVLNFIFLSSSMARDMK